MTNSPRLPPDEILEVAEISGEGICRAVFRGDGMVIERWGGGGWEPAPSVDYSDFHMAGVSLWKVLGVGIPITDTDFWIEPDVPEPEYPEAPEGLEVRHWECFIKRLPQILVGVSSIECAKEEAFRDLCWIDELHDTLCPAWKRVDHQIVDLATEVCWEQQRRQRVVDILTDTFGDGGNWASRRWRNHDPAARPSRVPQFSPWPHPYTMEKVAFEHMLVRRKEWPEDEAALRPIADELGLRAYWAVMRARDSEPWDSARVAKIEGELYRVRRNIVQVLDSQLGDWQDVEGDRPTVAMVRWVGNWMHPGGLHLVGLDLFGNCVADASEAIDDSSA